MQFSPGRMEANTNSYHREPPNGANRRSVGEVRLFEKLEEPDLSNRGFVIRGNTLCSSCHIIRDFRVTLRRWAICSICMLTLFVVLPSHVIAALPSPPIPGGVFALIKTGAPTRSSVLSNPDVDGISFRIGWSSVNPSEDKYDWSYFDTEIAKAKNAGKKVLLRVSAGQNIPGWVAAASKAAGEPTFSFYETAQQGGQLITEPVFWATTLLAKEAKFIAAFGGRYNSNPVVAI